MLNKLRSLMGSRSAAPAAPAADDEAVTLVNVYATCAELPVPTFAHQLHSRRDLSDPELRGHLGGFVGYVVSRGDGQMSYAKYHVMRHLQRVQQHWSLEVFERDLPAVSAWAEQGNALLLLTDGHVRDVNGRILVSAEDGGTDAQAYVPYPPQARERKARIDARLAEWGVPVPSHLPPVIAEPEVRWRTPAEVAGRALALYIVALRGESFAAQQALTTTQLRDRRPEAFSFLSPKEQAFLADTAPDDHAVTQFTWRYEALNVLLWALGLLDDLPMPNAICDVALMARTIDRCAELGAAARLRAPGELLDTLDLHYRLHWRSRQCELDGQPMPADLDPGVILERHFALNWLVHFEDADWDEVDTPT